MYTRSKQPSVQYNTPKRGPHQNQNQNQNYNMGPRNNQMNQVQNNTAPPQHTPLPKKQPELPIKQEPATPTTPKNVPPPPTPKVAETAMDVEMITSKPPPPVQLPSSAPTLPTEKVEKNDQTAGSETSTEAGEKPVPAWLRKKGPGFKINKRIKRRRQNARLRKILQPKNAIMVLNELKTGIKFTIQEQSSSLSPTVFIVHAEVDGKVFVGQGLSKPLAKQNAAENALKSLLLEKLVKASKNLGGSLNEGGEENAEGESSLNNNASGDAPSAAPAAATPTAQTQSGQGDAPSTDTPMETETSTAEDDMPWGSLASFALYRLFLDWQSQGTHVPFPRQTAAAAVPIETLPGLCKELYKEPVLQPPQAAKGPAAPMKKIPENPTERHPVMLLNQLRPGTLYVEMSRTGVAPNITFVMGCTVDGKNYTGTAKK